MYILDAYKREKFIERKKKVSLFNDFLIFLIFLINKTLYDKTQNTKQNI